MKEHYNCRILQIQCSGVLEHSKHHSATALARPWMSPRFMYIAFPTAAWMLIQIPRSRRFVSGDWGHCQIIFTLYFSSRSFMNVSQASLAVHAYQ
jgi:hypothetical protein